MKLQFGGIGEAFSDQNFRLYSIGAIVSWLCFLVQIVAVSWTTWELTHSTWWLAIIAVLDVLPNLLCLPFGGVLADRMDRVRILQVTYFLALLQALALAVLAASGLLTIAALAVLSFLHGLIHSFSMPGLYGLLPRFIARERLSSAIAVAAAYSQVAIFAGPALAGWIMAHFGAATAFATNVAGYAFYLCTLSMMRTPADYQAPKPSGRSVWGDMVDGFAYIVSHRGILAFMVVILLGNALNAAMRQMLPAYAAQELGMGVEGMTDLLAAAGFGATLSALWLAYGGARSATPTRVLWAFLAYSTMIAGLALVHGLILALVMMLLSGLAGEIRQTGTVSLLQLAVDNDQRGRVMSLQYMLQRLAAGIGAYLVGTSAEGASVRLPLLALAGLAALVGLALLFGRRGIAGAFAAVPH
ncbi:MFS transporter [Methylovirgula sp. 4M-Z18]|uniref:MFS transporter n=1 Tax=Methylovirgula sp. 4M-Z18 TaxID=2293567 RepID=UPI000E2F5036|nr:MFS transporter [Methylovirgula sp. 4M-Z18]RFB80970.1 MFS transporter [Methylovirgula sp. 4M-Z18]